MTEAGASALLGPADIRRLAEELDVRPTKKLGQNFVHDPNTVRRIVATAALDPHDVVLEVGPGLGSLTLALLPAAQRVVAIEIDPVLAKRLPETAAERAPDLAPRLTVVTADALRVTADQLAVPVDSLATATGSHAVSADSLFPPAGWCAASADPLATSAGQPADSLATSADRLAVPADSSADRLPVPAEHPAASADQPAGATERPAVPAADRHTTPDQLAHPTALVANLPYNISVPVVLHLLAELPTMTKALVMVQAEVADRMAASPGTKVYGVPSVKIAWYAEARRVATVPRSVFWPVPNVDSALVLLTRRPTPEADREAVFALVDAAFAQRRKTLRAALATWAGSADRAAEILTRAGVDPSARGETLTVSDFTSITRMAGKAHP